jgi:hypothetical protein
MTESEVTKVRFMTSDSAGWQDADGDESGKLSAVFSRVLTSRNLLVLSGLGTSMCIEGSNKNPAAPTMSDLWNTVKDANKKSFEEVTAMVNWDDSENVELLLSRCQMEQELRPNTTLANFISAGEKAIAESCNFITDKSDLDVHELFLRKIARRSTKVPRAQIFTTNYDLAFETAASRIGFAVIDGFTASIPARFDPGAFDRDMARRDAANPSEPVDWVPNVLQLHKLHGSIDWTASGISVTRGAVSERPVIVYPRSSKFEASYQQPFLEMMSRFQAALRRPNTGLIVAGCGFEDRHIMEPFMAAVRGNVGINIIVLSRSLEKKTNKVSGVMSSLIEQGDRRLALLAGSFPDGVEVMPDLVASTEDEIHEKRLTAAKDG